MVNNVLLLLVLLLESLNRLLSFFHARLQVLQLSFHSHVLHYQLVVNLLPPYHFLLLLLQ